MPKVKLGQSLRRESRQETLNRVVRVGMARAGIRTQKQLALVLGMPENAVGKRFRGDCKWKHDELCSLFLALHLSGNEIAEAMGAAK